MRTSTSAAGVGEVRVVAWEPDPAALLLDALGHPLSTLGLLVETQIEAR